MAPLNTKIPKQRMKNNLPSPFALKKLELKSTYFLKVYQKFVEEYDGVDNGVNRYEGEPKYDVTSTVSSRVSSFNPCWNADDKSPAAEMAGFEKAMKMVEAEFKGVADNKSCLTDRLKSCKKSSDKACFRSKLVPPRRNFLIVKKVENNFYARNFKSLFIQCLSCTVHKRKLGVVYVSENVEHRVSVASNVLGDGSFDSRNSNCIRQTKILFLIRFSNLFSYEPDNGLPVITGQI